MKTNKNENDLNIFKKNGEDYWFDELVGFEIQCLDCENVESSFE